VTHHFETNGRKNPKRKKEDYYLIPKNINKKGTIILRMIDQKVLQNFTIAGSFLKNFIFCCHACYMITSMYIHLIFGNSI
jgi:hypothetical protein